MCKKKRENIVSLHCSVCTKILHDSRQEKYKFNIWGIKLMFIELGMYNFVPNPKFKPNIHGLYTRAVTDQERVIVARVRYGVSS